MFFTSHGPSAAVGSPWREPAGQVALVLAFFMVALFPTLVVPWLTLAHRGRGWFVVAGAVLAWGLLTYGCIEVILPTTHNAGYNMAVQAGQQTPP